MKFSDWIQSLGFVTQSAHFHAGAFYVLALGILFHHWGHSPWWALLVFNLGWVIPKEYVYDRVSWGEGHGKPDKWDARFYFLGEIPACLLLSVL